ncbi:MBL fold metallo-hydrolase [Motiliproteus sp. MSK22-1]|uniref:MBL fold metallo-hydrolase n=1 Tax=Motiliproteus sp. MSK22-1 TaxID=1897630 RepID=UPI00097844A4|nr:MBL fold metallo-hydrolase [Motiliproteus sp. MSK22-1]OMH32110.1 MBL fold metallo-hydrolase [Motiliproteus sp. MSK22-1]
MNIPEVKAFFDETSNTISYIVSDPVNKHCAIIDSVLDYDPPSGRTSTQTADKMIECINACSLKIDWILETHVHADHLSAAAYLKEQLGGQIAISSQVPVVQQAFGKLFNIAEELADNEGLFDHLFENQEQFQVGNIKARSLHTPGHTPACMTYLIGDCAFIGDTLFMPDYGTARVDFPGGDAATLFHSIQKIYALPDQTRLFMCHDYKSPNRDHYLWETTVEEQKANNIHLNARTTEAEFVAIRESRDQELTAPRLILPSVQVNIRAGQLPAAEDNGIQYLKIPLNSLGTKQS